MSARPFNLTPWRIVPHSRGYCVERYDSAAHCTERAGGIFTSRHAAAQKLSALLAPARPAPLTSDLRPPISAIP
jgi:hypothetical protein